MSSSSSSSSSYDDPPPEHLKIKNIKSRFRESFIFC
jgi:hypothetical protein